MLDMTNAPIPIAIPAMAPGLILEPLLLTSGVGPAGSGGVVLDGVEAVKGTFIIEASDDAYSSGNSGKSLVCQNTWNGSANAVPDRASVGGCRKFVELTSVPKLSPSLTIEHTFATKSTATTVEFPESQRTHEELKILVKVVKASKGDVKVFSHR